MSCLAVDPLNYIASKMALHSVIALFLLSYADQERNHCEKPYVPLSWLLPSAMVLYEQL